MKINDIVESTNSKLAGAAPGIKIMTPQQFVAGAGDMPGEEGVAEGSLNELSSDLLKRSAQVATDKRNQAMDPELHNALGGGYMNPLATHYDNVSKKMNNRAAQVKRKETIKNIASKIASPAVMRKMRMSDMEEGVAEALDSNFVGFMNKTLGQKADAPTDKSPMPDFMKGAPVAGLDSMGYKAALDFGMKTLRKLTPTQKTKLSIKGEDGVVNWLANQAKKQGLLITDESDEDTQGKFMQEDLDEVQDFLPEVFHDPAIKSWAFVLTDGEPLPKAPVAGPFKVGINPGITGQNGYANADWKTVDTLENLPDARDLAQGLSQKNPKQFVAIWAANGKSAGFYWPGEGWRGIDEGVAEGFNGEYDDEAGMAHTNLLTSARAVMGLLKTINDKDNLPEWVQEKIANAEMMLVGVWDYLQSQKEQGIDPQQGVSEGWDDIKKFGKKAAVAGAIGLGIGAANAGGWSPSDVPAGGHNQLPDIVANVKFKVGDKEVSKEINLGSHYRSPGEAGEELKNFLNSKGIKFYQYSLERVKPKANDKIDNSPATSDMKGSMDTSEPGATGPSTDNYMAKDNDPERGPSTGGKFVKEDPYFESLQQMMERQLEPTMDLDAWVDNFQNADPNKYHQFKNKTPEKKK